MSQLKKILIVDDDKVNRRILYKILSDTYEVLMAENGKEALAILRESYESISAVLLDIIMPVMNGYEVLEEIRRDVFLSKIPVIVTTGSDDQGAEVKALSLGAHDFLVKPYKPAIILHRLANTIKLRETAALVNAVEKDALTNVYNKEFFYKKVERNLLNNPNTKYDIICLDIERFKLINDLFGMNAGDKLLKHVANSVKLLMDNDDICGRVGADKFACLIEHREDYEEQMFQRVIDRINEYPIKISVDVCFGIYFIDDTSIPINVMCDRALIACGSIKGKYDVHHAFYSDKFRQSLLSEQVIVDGMKTALNEHQFVVYYQPKYDLSTERIVGAEALVRWNHPTKGFLYPKDFIPLFERNGFITDLDYYLWDVVCQQLRTWIDKGYPLVPISVNVSRSDIYNPSLIQTLQNLVKKYELKPSFLPLEITETAYTENPDQLISTTKELRDLGFVIEMDDFGSGYSSLNMLSELPINILKLDMKFIQSETAKQNHKNILSFIISLAKWLNLEVVAEGVETLAQAQTLKSMDCNYAQGYFYAKALHHEDFESLLLHSDGRANRLVKNNKKELQDVVNIQKSQSDRVMMIVDDSELNRKNLSEIFCDLYNIVETNNGRDGFKYVQENYIEIDVILLDLLMPVMDGFEMLEMLKKDERLKNIPVIIISQTSEDNEERALLMGASDFITKPYSKEVALRRVSNVLAQSKLKTIEREHELARKVKEMRYKAEHDSLTGLYNRTAMETLVNEFFANNEGVDSSFFMLDIDNFKAVNDTFGHKKGDDLLVHVSDILSNSFRKKDIVARLGGDEFAVFIPARLTIMELRKKAKKLCEKLEIQLGGINISASIGIANSPMYGSDYQTLYKHSDSALLASKRLGKNQYVIFDTSMEMPSVTLYRNMDWLLDEINEAIVICDMKDYEILYLNSKAAEIAGKDKLSCIGNRCYKTLWKRDQPCTHCIKGCDLLDTYISQEVDDEVNKRHFIIRDKLMVWNGKSARIQYIQDDTERNNFKKDLIQVNESLSNILECSQGAFVKCKMDEKWSIEDASDTFYEMIGYKKEELKKNKNNSLLEIIDTQNYAAHQEERKQAFLNHEKAYIETCFINALGQKVLVHEKSSLVVAANKDAYFYASFLLK